MPNLTPVLASKYIQLDEMLQEVCRVNNLVPVNDALYEYWGCDSSIVLLFGGPGGSKSNFWLLKLLQKSMNQPYFKCLFGRKVKDTVRESIFSTICDIIEEHEWREEFIYSRADNSSMIITHWPTGNKFIPFGADKVTKLKSLNNPTDIFCDEFDQFTFDDFKELLPRLRVPGVITQFAGAFNTKDVNPLHWLWKMFFDPKKDFLEQLQVFIPKANYTVTKIFVNYYHNWFLDLDQYHQQLVIASGFDEKIIRTLTDGEFGSADMTNKYAWAFNTVAHVIDITTPAGAELMTIDPRLPLYVCFDFNVDPMVAIVFQMKKLEWIKVFAELRLRNSDIYEMTGRIETDYSDRFIKVTGDATGKNRSGTTKGAKSYVQIIKQELGLSVLQVEFPSVNPGYKEARVVLNAVFRKCKVMIASSCQFLINDLQTIGVDHEGKVEKEKEEKKKKNHLLDTIKYAFWNYFRGIVYGKKKGDPDDGDK